jgi:hypothetical protein
VYSSNSSSTGTDSGQGSRNTSQAGAEEAAGSSSKAGEQQQQQRLEQEGAAADAAGEQQEHAVSRSEQRAQHTDALQSSTAQHPGQEGDGHIQQHHAQPQQQQQPVELSQPPPQPQQQLPQQEAQQPPAVEWGAYYSRSPVRQYHGHCEDILDVSWSGSGGFLLSASLDKTVRLWHLSQPDCLRAFEHSDFVTSVQFHPTDAQRFVSGGCNSKPGATAFYF